MSKLTLKTEGDRHVVVTRRFAASPKAVFRAHTEPELIQKWMLGPDGWTMPVCVCDARPGGKFRYEEDLLNMVHVLEDMRESHCKVPDVAMPPRHPNRDFSRPPGT